MSRPDPLPSELPLPSEESAVQAKGSVVTAAAVSLACDPALVARELVTAQSLRLLEAKLRHAKIDPRDPFPISGLRGGRQRDPKRVLLAPGELAKFALDAGGPKGFRVTKRHVMDLLTLALQRQLISDDGLAIMSARFIVDSAGRRAYDFVRFCLLPVKAGYRGGGINTCTKYNVYAALLFIYRVILSQDEHVRRKLLRRTALYLPYAHKALLETAVAMPAVRPELLGTCNLTLRSQPRPIVGNFQHSAGSEAKVTNNGLADSRAGFAALNIGPGRDGCAAPDDAAVVDR